MNIQDCQSSSLQNIVTILPKTSEYKKGELLVAVMQNSSEKVEDFCALASTPEKDEALLLATSKDYSALILTTIGGHLVTAVYLLYVGTPLTTTNGLGLSAFDYALTFGHNTILQYFGSFIDITDKKIKPTVTPLEIADKVFGNHKNTTHKNYAIQSV